LLLVAAVVVVDESFFSAEAGQGRRAYSHASHFLTFDSTQSVVICDTRVRWIRENNVKCKIQTKKWFTVSLHGGMHFVIFQWLLSLFGAKGQNSKCEGIDRRGFYGAAHEA
jgi:hypothetical protein